MTDQPDGDTCRPVEIDGETIRVRGAAEMSDEGREALTSLVRAAKAKMTAEAPDQIGALQNRLRLAHQARRAKEHQLDDIRRALCDIGFMDDDDPYSHADLADVIRQNGSAPEVKAHGQPGPAAGDTIQTGPDRLAQTGVDTPGCDCGHEGMGVSWHGDDCPWRCSVLEGRRPA